ncbi:MAG: putative motility protein [Firmicutes bacterium HGW-Firmicutes-15]|nr:MAG: putative motility protein [Firmicutes bacterium HGW-Firmicutes-15]
MDTNAIAGMAMGMKAASLQQAVSTGVLKMQMDSTEQSAQALVKMMNVNTQIMEKSVNPYLGASVDILA